MSQQNNLIRKALPLIAGALIGAAVWPVAAQAADQGFFGADLAEVGQPYQLQLPGDSPFQVNWGDGHTESVRGPVATHLFTSPGVAGIAVRSHVNGDWATVPVDAVEAVVAAHPVAIAQGPVGPGTVLTLDRPVSVDSFSLEFRVRPEDPTADQTFFVSAEASAGGVGFGLHGGKLSFVLAGAGEFSGPLPALWRTGEWHTVAVSYERDGLFPRSNRVCLYADGLLVGDGTIDVDDAGPVTFSSAKVGGNGFRGQIESLAVYDRLLFPLTLRDHARVLAGATILPITVAFPGASPFTVDEPVIRQTVDLPLDPDPAADNGPALRRAMSAAPPGTRLRLVDRDHPGQGGRFAVRSLVQGNKWAGLLAENKTDFELDGNGGTLVFSDQVARYLLIDHCERIAIRNLSFDLDPAYARVGVYAKLLEVNPAAQTLEVQLVNGRDGSPLAVIPKRASYWRWRPTDPVTFRIGKGPYFRSDTYAGKPVPDPARGPGVLRFTLKPGPDDKLWSDLQAYKDGANFFLINNADFSSNAVSLMDSSQIIFDHVNYYATLGMVFLSSNIDHIQVTHCKIGLPPGETVRDRPLASGADGYHFHLTRGSILFEDNEICLTDDDPISLKDSIRPHLEKVSDNQLRAGKDFHVGDPVELLEPDYSASGYTTHVTAVDGQVITLDQALPASFAPGWMLMNRSTHTRDWIIRDNYLHDFYGRVMLYTDYGTVTGNRITRSYYHLGNSTAYFETAGSSRNVITHGNLFESTHADSSQWGGNQDLPAFHQETYSANSFLGAGLDLNNAEGSLVARNGFYGPGASLAVKRSVGTKVLDNLGFASGDRGVVLQEERNAGTIANGNGEAAAFAPGLK